MPICCEAVVSASRIRPPRTSRGTRVVVVVGIDTGKVVGFCHGAAHGWACPTKRPALRKGRLDPSKGKARPRGSSAELPLNSGLRLAMSTIRLSPDSSEAVQTGETNAQQSTLQGGDFVTNGPNPQWWNSHPNPAEGATQVGWPLPPAPQQAGPGWAPQQHQGYPSMSQPPGQQPWPAGPAMQGGYLGPPGGPPRRSRKPLIIALSVVAAIAVVLIVVISLVSTSSEKSTKAGDVVKGYLDALSRGDAEAALSYSNDQPGSKDLLSDGILKAQVARWPITDVQILSDNSERSFGYAQVHVSAKFGDQTSDVTLPVKKSGSQWQLEHAAIKVDALGTMDNEALDTLTFFSTAVGKSPVYVFPGFVDAASSNSNVAVKLKKPYLLDALNSGSSYFSQVDFALSDTGQSAIMSAISAELADCVRSNRLAPPDCPQRVRDPDLVEGTAAWGNPDTSGLKVTLFDPYHLEVLVSGEVNFPLTAGAKGGGTKSGMVHTHLSVKSDVSQSPPLVSLR